MHMTHESITAEMIKQHGLTPEEYERIQKILGREPNYTELGIFSVMWSEHCSYKNTRPLLKTFPTQSKKILVGAGEENAGIIDIGDGLAVAFKIESHNHPSAVEPFQGAATGVGGIIRDIFTMGARPVAAMNSLRFGPITEDSPPHPGPLPPMGGEGENAGGDGEIPSGSTGASPSGHPAHEPGANQPTPDPSQGGNSPSAPLLGGAGGGFRATTRAQGSEDSLPGGEGGPTLAEG